MLNLDDNDGEGGRKEASAVLASGPKSVLATSAKSIIEPPFSTCDSAARLIGPSLSSRSGS